MGRPLIADNTVARDERIERLERIVFALVESAKRTPDRGSTLEALRAALTAECLRCGAVVGGPELLLLARLPGPDDTPRLQRLRQGHCVRANCAFNHYRIHFQRHPDLNWRHLLNPPEAGDADASRSELARTHSPHPAPAPRVFDDNAEALMAESARRRRLVRTAVLVTALLLLLLWRHIYIGGTIPLIREPENFRVDPWPPGYEEPEH